TASPAMAWTYESCPWNEANLRIDTRYVNGSFNTAINQSINDYNAHTDVTLTSVKVSGPAFTARNAGYGATGWEGQTSWTCSIWVKKTGAQMKLNEYYLMNIVSNVPRLKVVWEHETGHGLGIGHVSSAYRVMYKSASTAYNNGVTQLTSDEITGINTIY